jgi:hypothetical protein
MCAAHTAAPLPLPGVPRNSKAPHTTSQDWPHGGLHSGAAKPTDDSQAQVEVKKYEGESLKCKFHYDCVGRICLCSALTIAMLGTVHLGCCLL